MKTRLPWTQARIETRLSPSGAGSRDYWLLRLAENGDLLWETTHGGPQADVAWWIRQTADGGFIVGGTTASTGAGGDDIWLLKLAEDGTLECQ